MTPTPPIASQLALPLCAALMLAVPTARADDATGYLNQRVWLQAHLFRSTIDSTVQADPIAGLPGTRIGFEDDLGLDDRESLPAVLLGARFGERWRAEFEYFRLDRSGSRSIRRTLQYEDTTYLASASLDSRFSTKVYRAGLGYSLLRRPDAEAGVVAGLHVTDFKLSLNGQASGNGGSTVVRRVAEEKTVPLPTIGAYGTVAFGGSWLASARADLLAIRVGDYEGSLVNLQASVQYRVTPNVGVGLGYRYDDYRLRAKRDDFRGRVEYTFRGPQVFLDVGF